MPYVPPIDILLRLQAELEDEAKTAESQTPLRLVDVPISSPTERENNDPRAPSRNDVSKSPFEKPLPPEPPEPLWFVDLDELDGAGGPDGFREILDRSWDDSPPWAKLEGKTLVGYLRSAMRRAKLGVRGLAKATRHDRRVTSRWVNKANLPAPCNLQAIFVVLAMSQPERDRFRRLWSRLYYSPERLDRRRKAADKLRGHKNGISDEEYLLIKREQTRQRVRRFRERRRLAEEAAREAQAAAASTISDLSNPTQNPTNPKENSK